MQHRAKRRLGGGVGPSLGNETGPDAGVHRRGWLVACRTACGSAHGATLASEQLIERYA